MRSLTRARDVRGRLVEHRWDWAERNADLIGANWARRTAATPRIFDGRVLMSVGREPFADVAEPRFFVTNYAAMLAWIDAGCPDESVANAFAMGAIRCRDGAFLLGEMAPGTANAGRLYFPCGTPDMTDVTGAGEVDLAGSLEREIAEETGLPRDSLDVEHGWTIVRADGLLAFIRLVTLDRDAEDARGIILRSIQAQAEPELVDIHIVRTSACLEASRMPAVVPIFLVDAFQRT